MGTYFKAAGYDTAYIGKWHLCYAEKDPRPHGFEIIKAKSTGGHDADVTDGALKFLARTHDKPFLLVASFLNPHNICEWARRLAGRTQRLNCGEIGEPPALDQLPPAPFNLAPPKNEPDSMTLIRRAEQVEDGPFPVGKFTPDDWRKHRWGYYRMAELVDKEIGRVLEALRKAGLEENTLIVFTADHGECAGAHGFNQKTVLYEESARVPLIVSWKGKTPAAISDKLVNTGIDILPTLLDAAGLAMPKKLPGRSLLPLALGKEVPAWREYVVVENNMSQTGTVDGMQAHDGRPDGPHGPLQVLRLQPRPTAGVARGFAGGSGRDERPRHRSELSQSAPGTSGTADAVWQGARRPAGGRTSRRQREANPFHGRRSIGRKTKRKTK